MVHSRLRYPIDQKINLLNFAPQNINLFQPSYCTILHFSRWDLWMPCNTLGDKLHFPLALHVGLKTDGKNPVLTCSVFYFVPSVFVFVRSRFCIYGNERGVFPYVSVGSRFHPELTRICSFFHPVFNLCEICLEIDIFINLLIINYAC